MWCLKNARSIENTVSLQDRAFQYGDGCFSTVRVVQGKMELYERHIQRLKKSATALQLTVNWQNLAQSLLYLQTEQPQATGTLKILISRGEGQRGYSLPCHAADLYVFFYPQAFHEHTYSYMVSGVLQQSIGLTMPTLVGLKSLNRLEQVMLKQEADQRQWLEALVGDVHGNLVEGVSSNCFIFKNDRWITPELRYNGVHGVMRAEILARMHDHQVVCEQRSIYMQELQDIEALFFCNALHAMKIVTKLDQHPLNPQPCMDLFHTLQLAHI